jgi:hypothetical protein
VSTLVSVWREIGVGGPRVVDESGDQWVVDGEGGGGVGRRAHVGSQGGQFLWREQAAAPVETGSEHPEQSVGGPRLDCIGGGQIPQQQFVPCVRAVEVQYGTDFIATAQDVDPDGVGPAGETGGDGRDAVGLTPDPQRQRDEIGKAGGVAHRGCS